MVAATVSFLIAAVVVSSMIVRCQSDKETETNIICSNERDTSFVNVYSGHITELNIREEKECRMKLTVPGTVRVDVVVNSLHFSSRDCTEEYFAIRENNGRIVPNTTLCSGTSPGTRVIYYFTASATAGSQVIFYIKMDRDGDLLANQQSFIDLSFAITDASSYVRPTTTTASPPSQRVTAAPTTAAVPVRTTTASPRNMAAMVTTGQQATATRTSKAAPAAAAPAARATAASATTPRTSTATEPENVAAKEALTTTVSDEYVTVSIDTTVRPEDIEVGDPIPDQGNIPLGLQIDSKILGISIGLVSTTLVIVVVVLILFFMRTKRAKPSDSSSSGGSRRERNISVQDHDVQIIPLPRPRGNFEMQNNYDLPQHIAPHRSTVHAKPEPVYYSHISEGNARRVTIASGMVKPGTFNNRQRPGRLLDADTLDNDNYHRLESLTEGLASRRSRYPVEGVKVGNGSSRVAKLSVDSGVEEDYADISDFRYDEPIAVHSSSRMSCERQNNSNSRKEFDDSGHMDQYGYVIVLPPLSNEETAAVDELSSKQEDKEPAQDSDYQLAESPK